MAERLISCAAHTKLLLPALSLPAVRTRCDLYRLCGLKNKLRLALASVLQDASYRPRSAARRVNCDAAGQLSSIQCLSPAVRPLWEIWWHLAETALCTPALLPSHHTLRLCATGTDRQVTVKAL